jgi:hypothetical protein
VRSQSGTLGAIVALFASTISPETLVGTPTRGARMVRLVRSPSAFWLAAASPERAKPELDAPLKLVQHPQHRLRRPAQTRTLIGLLFLLTMAALMPRPSASRETVVRLQSGTLGAIVALFASTISPETLAGTPTRGARMVRLVRSPSAFWLAAASPERAKPELDAPLKLVQHPKHRLRQPARTQDGVVSTLAAAAGNLTARMEMVVRLPLGMVWAQAA